MAQYSAGATQVRRRPGGYSPPPSPATELPRRPSVRFEPHVGAGEWPFADLATTPPRATGLAASVADQLRAFAAASGNGAWPYLPRAGIAARLRTLASGPAGAAQVYQDGINACGPAAAMYLLARDSPERLLDLATALYDKGSGPFGSITVKGDGLFGHDPLKWSDLPVDASGKIGQRIPKGEWLADWMLLASLRRSEDSASNAVFEFDGKPDDGVSGITWPGDMERWLSKGLEYSKVRDETNLMLNKDLDHLMRMSPDTNRVVVLFLNVDVLSGGSKKAKKSKGSGRGSVLEAFPNHYAPLLKPAKDDGSPVEVWSWGQTVQLPPLKERGRWEEAYFGALVAER